MGLLDQLTQGANLGSVADMIQQNPDIARAAGSLLGEGEESVGPSGGLNELLGQLSSSGMADQVASWLGTGANQPVSANQLSEALGGDTIAQFAEQAGIDPALASAALAEVLPALIDQLSPEGTAPEGNVLAGLLSQLS